MAAEVPKGANDLVSGDAVGETAAMSDEILHTHPLIEEIFATHREHARGDDAGYEGYRGHAYRVLNLARAIVPDEDERDDKLAVAAAFHDLDAFTALDYLASSIRAQDAWLQRTGRGAWAAELAVVVAQHHRFLPYRGAHAQLAEAFRRADLADLSQGLVRSGIPRPHVRAVRAAFDVGPFFTRVVPRAVARNLVRHPLDPLPNARARRALAQAGHGPEG
jgi:hypothetical protein